MKRTIAFLLVAALLAALSGCNNPVNSEPFKWNGENRSPIPAVYELSEEDIEDVFFFGSQYIEGRFSFEWEERYTWLLNNLRRLELLERVDGYTVTSAKETLCYEIQLKNRDPIILNFYDDIVNFGEGYYFYTDADNSTVPDEINGISIGLQGFSSGYYDDPGDIEQLRSILTALENANASVPGVEDSSALMDIYINDWTTESILLYVKAENGAFNIFKNLFTSYIYLGQINRDGYDSLVLACKNQFGTRAHFSVTSGETTIYPLEHFMYGMSYDEQTGGGVAADGFPQLSDWYDSLETVYYEPNFSVWVKDEQSSLSISVADSHAVVTYEDIKDLPSGEYTIACQLSIQGEFVEKANAYNSYTSVYWFKLIKP